MTAAHPRSFHLNDHKQVLEWIDRSKSLDVDFSEVGDAHIWALVALAVMHGDADGKPVQVKFDSTSPPSRFAHAVGFDSLLGERVGRSRLEPNRTVRLVNVRQLAEIERVAREISTLLVQKSDADETRRTIYYILVEFLRNAVQHSGHPAGAIVGAQLMDKSGRYGNRPMIQVAVGDAGFGIMRTLQATYPEIIDPKQALVMAQQPWVSSAFERGQRGGKFNAGLGLFFISEMAKRTAGRLLLSSRGSSLLLQGDQDAQRHHIRAEPAGYPGTLAVFELPRDEIQDYDALIGVIQEVANERIRKKENIRFLRFEAAPDRSALKVGVRVGAEDTHRAQRLVDDHFIPRLTQSESIQLDFSGLQVCTQSYLHALLFLPLREAFKRDGKIYITNATPAIRGALEFLEGYALPP
jgi:anti-sigma regulatory factor (Ser/Thr protein kinase)